jgi:uncharacterized cupredoxin-like copper-binding protein
MFKLTASIAIAGVAMMALLAAPATAEGNLASGGVEIDLKIDTDELKFSPDTIELETGKYYRMNISVEDADDTAFVAPDFFRNVWINQIVVNDLEIKVQNPYSLEWDAAGTFSVAFVPIRPGEYSFAVAGYEDRGLQGKFVVK